jgi:hypothetical protein
VALLEACIRGSQEASLIVGVLKGWSFASSVYQFSVSVFSSFLLLLAALLLLWTCVFFCFLSFIFSQF